MVTQVQACSSCYVKTLLCKMLPIRSYFQILRMDFPNFQNNYSCLFFPFNKTHHESSLIFLNVSIKPESVKPLPTAPGRKDHTMNRDIPRCQRLKPAIDCLNMTCVFAPGTASKISASDLLRIKCQ